MTYDETKHAIVTHAEAVAEIRRHGCHDQVEDFYRDCGKKDTYPARQVLHWLGY